MPTQWSSALHRSTIALPPGTSLGIAAVDGDLAFGQLDRSGTLGVGSVDLTSGRVTLLFPYAKGVSGLGALVVERPWVVWEQLDSIADMSDWSIHAFNLLTSTHFVLAGKAKVPGPQPSPVLSHGTVAWAQPQPDRTMAIQVADLNTRHIRTLATGKLGAPAYAGGYLLWSDVDSGFHGVDAQTLQPAALPESLTHQGSVGFLGGSADRVVWSSPDSSTLHAIRLPLGSVETYALADRRHFFQFLQLAGDFVVWYSGTASSVLDLTTGKGFDVPGTATGSGQWIATAGPAKPGASVAVSRIPTTEATHITACG